MLASIEQVRLEISKNTESDKKSFFGQFLTPATTAQFMADLFSPSTNGVCRLLDPGAGIGSLSGAFLEKYISNKFIFSKIEINAYEIDNFLIKELENTYANCLERIPYIYKIIKKDFIEDAINQIQFNPNNRYTHAILNPPYKKINSHSKHRLLLRQLGIETVNLYSAFVALSISLLAPNGQLVAIVPRSFCNGPYYRSFREFLMEHTAIRQMHLFTSRNTAFKDDNVLQENVIIKLERDGKQGNVIISTSTDDSFSDLVAHSLPFNQIVLPNDPEHFIHIPASKEQNIYQLPLIFSSSLEELGLSVSTGPIVDFRVKSHLSKNIMPGTVPLLYPTHFKDQNTNWPKPEAKKPNAIRRNAETEKWLYPTGYYCVVRRFSSKEEKRRIVASVVEPNVFLKAQMLGFENHLNVFHIKKQSLPEKLARGLALYLNTTAIDHYFRRFSGHTQVNATDLRLLKYPNNETLTTIGTWAMRNKELTQDMIDEKIKSLIT